MDDEQGYPDLWNPQHEQVLNLMCTMKWFGLRESLGNFNFTPNKPQRTDSFRCDGQTAKLNQSIQAQMDDYYSIKNKGCLITIEMIE